MKRLHFFKGILLCFVLLSIKASAQNNFLKSIQISVKDSRSGTAVPNATVVLKGLLKKTSKTDASGNATFQIPLLLKSQVVNFEVFIKDGFGVTTGRTESSFTLTQNKDDYIIPVKLSTSSGMKKVVVTVVDEKGNRVGGARVKLGDVAIGYSQADGVCVMDEISLLESKHTFTLNVEKTGFGNYTSTLEINNETDVFPATVTIKKDAGYKLVKVHVTGSDYNYPVEGAYITAVGHGVTNTFSGTTDKDGNAMLIFNSSGKFDVTIKHHSYRTATESIEVQHLEEDKNYLFNFILNKEEINEGIVEVYVQNIDGKPLQDVSVTLSYTGAFPGLTDANGITKIAHKILPGEYIEVRVVKEGYKVQTKRVMVGENQRNVRSITNLHDIVNFTLEKGTTGKLQIVALVIDATNNHPIPYANTVIKKYSGQAVSLTVQTSVNGEASLFVDEKDIKSGQFRLVASANNYEERWSDIDEKLLTSNTGKRYFQISLKPKKTTIAQEKKYGSFTVTPQDEWVSTGITIAKGGYFRVETTGEYTSADKTMHVNPDGGGNNWGWWSLVGKIGDQRFALGKSGDGTSKDGGVLELGTPRVKSFFAEDKALQGSYTVFVFSKDASFKAESEVKINNSSISATIDNNVPPPPTSQNLEKAKKDLEFLKRIALGEVPQNSNLDDVMMGISYVMSQYKLYFKPNEHVK